MTAGVLRVDTVDTTVRLRALEPEWRALWRACADASVFLSPDWLLPWWDVFGNERLRTAAVYDGSRLVALAPLYVHADAARGDRTMLFVGASLSDRHELLALDGYAAAAADAVVAWLGELGAEWDACDLRQLAPASPLLGARPPVEVRETIAADEPCTVVPLPSSVDALQEVVPKKQLEKARYYARRAERTAPLSLEVATADRVLPVLDELIALHTTRWRERGQRGMLADPAVVRFHRAAAPRLCAAGVLRLYALCHGDEVAAVYYGFRHGTRSSAYLSGFDPDRAPLSPGLLLLHHAIVRAIQDGATVMDFLRGRERYKYGWGVRDQPTFRRRFAHAAARVSA